MNCVVLGLGSNRSFNGVDSITILRMAVRELEKIMDKPVFSSVYRTKPMYVEDQDDFYNMVMMGLLHEEFSPDSLLEHIHKIESALGRDRAKEIRFGPRSIDIDIEFFGEKEINTENLEIPHPRLQERGFVLKPLLEILSKYSDEYSDIKGEKLKTIESDFQNVHFDDVEHFIDSTEFFLNE